MILLFTRNDANPDDLVVGFKTNPLPLGRSDKVTSETKMNSFIVVVVVVVVVVTIEKK